jgi:RNA polymerase sigma-70 factor (ECF subfamily)
MQGLKDEEVMLKYQQGELQAMDELLHRFKTPIYRFCFRLTGNDAEAQDIAQEVFLRVHQSKEAYLPTGKFSTWIFSIAHHLAISRIRKKKWLVIWPRKDDESDELKEFESPNPSPKDVVSDNEVAGIVKRCIQSLPFLQREALVLREYENLDYAEIAKILKKSQGTIKTLIHRARENLKHKLLPYVEEFRGGHHA